MPTEQSLDIVKIHKVPNLEVWEQNYQTTQNPNGLIEPGDLVSFPPNLLGEVLPDYPETAGTTFLKAVTTVNGNETETVTSWGESALGDTITIDSSINAQSAGIPSSSAVRTLVNSLDATAVGALPANTTYVSTFNGSSGAITYTAPVTSVNTQTGNVSLTAVNVGAIPSSQKGAASGVATLDNNFKVTASQTAAKIIRNNNDSFSLTPSNAGQLILMNNSDSNPAYVNIYFDEDFVEGTEIEIMKYGTAPSIIIRPQGAGGSGVRVKLNGSTSFTASLTDRYTSAVLKLITKHEGSEDFDEWVIQGAIS